MKDKYAHKSGDILVFINYFGYILYIDIIHNNRHRKCLFIYLDFFFL